jgi:sugar O-acyltransferase (sialic acid O-acetyltransferase NeuD family)
MEKTKYLLIGAGGHARVILSSIDYSTINVVGIFDLDKSKTILDSIPVIGNYQSGIFPEAKIIIAIGDNLKRNQITSIVKHDFGKVINPSSKVDKLTKIGEGSVIFHESIIQRGTSIGNHCIINTNSSVDHDCSLGNFVHIAPGSILCGNVSVGSNTIIGAGSTIIPNINIGENVTVGAGSIVLSDIPDGMTVFGNPAKVYSKDA